MKFNIQTREERDAENAAHKAHWRAVNKAARIEKTKRAVRYTLWTVAGVVVTIPPIFIVYSLATH